MNEKNNKNSMKIDYVFGGRTIYPNWRKDYL